METEGRAEGGKELDKPRGEEPPERNKEQETNPERRGKPPPHQPLCVLRLTRVSAYGVWSGDLGVSLRTSSVRFSLPIASSV
ncbi:hypothetical protein EYF80_022154 [Liparis tanakae]|uniref:Uncharacterized protein n=1 Tax=Liparis tanakae TaxID=230148 RepID=A0A4Z2HQL9_9TELE|nr:hypothetical protein EYF80_022154 [Liparis tanakae]